MLAELGLDRDDDLSLLPSQVKFAGTSRHQGTAMKDKHLAIRIEQCLALAKASNCPRRRFGALLVDPERNVVLMDGYNGGPRGGGRLCGGEVCLRDAEDVVSGTRVEIGCHHAEMNLICNAAANGVPTKAHGSS